MKHARLGWTVTGCCLLLACLLVASRGAISPAAASPPGALSKIDPWVLDRAAGGPVEFIVFLAEQANLNPAADLDTKDTKGHFVYQALTQTARRTQAPLIRQLEALGIEHRPFWIANMVWVRGDRAALDILAARSDVARIHANPAVRLDQPDEAAGLQADPSAASAIEWNLLAVQADRVWAAGALGQGVVIAGADTGYDWDHPALKTQYRGWDGATTDHNYNWYDAIHENVPGSPAGNPSCGFDSPEPCDDYGHGTHTMGTMTGDDGLGNQIGMAPGARWIGCRNMDQGVGSPATYAECYQWFLAPTDLDGANPDPGKAPHIINNSWACPPSEGCTDPAVLQAVVAAVRAAGILTVHSAGNSGPSCGTITAPAAIYAESFTVANTTAAGALAASSSRGPVSVDGSGRIKPDIAAPGTSIRSTRVGGGYAVLSGTSMAGPHVAGLAALLISARPELAGQADTLESLMAQNTVPVTVSPVQTCGGIPSTILPNNSYGWGRIDAWGAYQALFPYKLYFPLFFNAGE